MRTSPAAAVVVALLFVVSGCGGNGEEASPPPPSAAVTDEAATGVQTPPQPPPPDSLGPLRVAVSVRGGAVVGGVRRVSVDRGREVVFLVRADVRDHVHLHGYDLLTDVAPGSPARIRFAADMPGRFEIELEDAALPIAELTVRR